MAELKLEMGTIIYILLVQYVRHYPTPHPNQWAPATPLGLGILVGATEKN